jgi:hypothetical protein
MRRITIVFVCAMIAPLAFGQPVANTSVVKHTGQTLRAPTQMTTGAVRIGSVTAFNPGLRNVEPPSPIVVLSSPDTKPVSYMLGKRVRFVDKDGRAVDRHMVRAGTRVQLGFDRRGRVSRVVVVEK